jgi:hypothetical protein
LAPDGSLAVLSNSASVQAARLSYSSNEGTIALYSPRGDALDAWPVPARASDLQGRIAFDGKHLAFLVARKLWDEPTTVVVTDAHGQLLSRFKPEHAPKGVFFVRGAESPELWLFDGKTSMDRYAVQGVVDGGMSQPAHAARMAR